MRKFALIAIAFAVSLLSAAAIAPWLIYWYGLNQIDGRPTVATHSATTEQTDDLLRRLKIPQPVQLESLSPCTYFLQGRYPNASSRIAWIIARSHNAEHLADRRMAFWHLSGMSLTIWLTRNWTATELIAKAVELDKNTASRPTRPR